MALIWGGDPPDPDYIRGSFIRSLTQTRGEMTTTEGKHVGTTGEDSTDEIFATEIRSAVQGERVTFGPIRNEPFAGCYTLSVTPDSELYGDAYSTCILSREAATALLHKMLGDTVLRAAAQIHLRTPRA